MTATTSSHNRIDEAVTTLRPLAESGYHLAAWRLADLLEDQGRIDEAIAVLRPLAAAGEEFAVTWSAELHRRRQQS